MYHNELYHFGIKGMHWGVRRFEDKNGHLTTAGKKRYDDKIDDAVKEYEKAQKHITKAAGGANTRAAAYATQAVARTYASKNATRLQKHLYAAHVTRILKKERKTKLHEITTNKSDSAFTKAVKADYNNISELEFRAKYHTTKQKYAKRVAKSRTGDPLKSGKTAAMVALNAYDTRITKKTGKTTAERANEKLIGNRR